MEKRYFLTNGCSKWISIGIVPETKLLAGDAKGFYADIFFGGNKMTKPMSAGGVNGFLFICQLLRTLDEFKFSFPATKGDYSAIEDDVPITIAQKNFGSTVCYQINNFITGEIAYMAITSVMELLKIENLIVSAATAMANLATDFEKKYVDLVAKCSTDFSETLKELEKSGDLFAIEMAINFGELFKINIEEMARINQLAETQLTEATAEPQKRKRVVRQKSGVKKPHIETAAIEPQVTDPTTAPIENQQQSIEPLGSDKAVNVPIENQSQPIGQTASDKAVSTPIEKPKRSIEIQANAQSAVARDHAYGAVAGESGLDSDFDDDDNL